MKNQRINKFAVAIIIITGIGLAFVIGVGVGVYKWFPYSLLSDLKGGVYFKNLSHTKVLTGNCFNLLLMPLS